MFRLRFSVISEPLIIHGSTGLIRAETQAAWYRAAWVFNCDQPGPNSAGQSLVGWTVDKPLTL